MNSFKFWYKSEKEFIIDKEGKTPQYLERMI